MYLILFLLWAAFQLFSCLTAEDPQEASKRRVEQYIKFCEMSGQKRYNPAAQIQLRTHLWHEIDFNAPKCYNKKYLKELLGYDIDYKYAAHHPKYVEQITQDVADKEGWLVLPPGKTWQEMEPRYWEANWGYKEYHQWMRKHNLKPQYPQKDNVKKHMELPIGTQEQIQGF